MNGKMKHIIKQHSLGVVQAWIKEDEEEASTVITIALHCKCGSGPTKELEDEEQLQAYCKCGEDHEDEYIKFIAKFGPAMTGVSYWNNNKANIIVSELLTVTDEAFIHLCMINYAPTWKAQEKRKWGEDVQVPVSEIHCDEIHCEMAGHDEKQG
jgi:negative regulator of genetic competence, sporulation and motility